jgi:4-hydroxy-3-methylbut-2-enyl diphosphate reductase
MEIVFVESLGYCPGVEHALRLANNAVDSHEGPVHALGLLIHNDQEMQRLAGKGLKVVNSFGEVSEGTVVVRAHGIPYQQFDEAKERGLDVRDGTCSIVTRAQRAARKLRAEGRRVVIYGDPNHPEVIGVVGAVDGQAEVISSVADARALSVSAGEAVGLICQTTKQPERYREVAAVLAQRCDLKVTDTICPYVIQRQSETRQVAEMVDVMVVIGGHHSSNTKRLADLSAEAGARAYHVDTPDELDPAWFAGVKRVGITSGLSTPVWIVDQVVDRIREFGAGA